MANVERKLLRTLRSVRRIDPAAESVARATRGARQAVDAARRTNSHPIVWRLIVPTGIAAVIVAIVSVLGVLMSHAEASAADALKDLAEINEAYRGWIRATGVNPPPPEQGGPAATSFTIHTNMRQQIYIKDTMTDGRRVIEWVNRSEGTFQQYTSENNQLIIGTLPRVPPIFRVIEDMKARKNVSSQELTAILVTQPTMQGVTALIGYGCGVTRREDGALERFDLSMPVIAGAATAPSAQPFLSLVFDRRSKLLQTWAATFDGRLVSFVYTYGGPDTRTIYDLGVPKDAKVIDRRRSVTESDRFATMTPQAADMVERLTQKTGANELWGAHVAIETLSFAGQGRLSPLTLMIYGRSGERRYFGSYMNVKQRRLELTGWPTPDMGVIERAQSERPDRVFVSDGHQHWITWPDGGIHHGQRTDMKYFSADTASGSILLPIIWFANGFDPRLTVNVQHLAGDPYPGLRIVIDGEGKPGENHQRENVMRVDPARDDVPVSGSEVMRDSGGTVLWKTQTQYLEYVELPGGHWLPTRWTDTTTSQQQAEPMVREHRLQIFLGEHLPEVWFSDPTTRFAPQQAATSPAQ